MYSLVLIDDELWALNDLRELIDWESLGFTDIKCFDDPSAAFESIRNDPPDAVFTDIRMPVLSGLDLIDRCREKEIKTLFVIVSAYADFSYAKRAIENNAFAYILKPLDPAELREVAEKVRDRLQNDFNLLLNRTVRTLTLQALTSQNNNFENIPSEFKAHFNAEYRILVSGQVPEQFPGIWTSVYDDLSVGICPAAVDLPETEQKFGISTGSDQILEMPGKIREALMAYYTLLFYGLPDSVSYHTGRIDLREIQMLRELISEQKYTQAKLQLNAVLSQAKANVIMLDEITFFYNSLLLQILSVKNDLIQDIRPFSDCFRLFGIMRNDANVYGSLVAMIDNLLPNKADRPESTQDTIRKIVRYVDENYNQDITLESLAQKYYISVSYLSRKFKEIMDDTFSDYLSRKRIEKACQLLDASELSISEIGMVCGYPNCFYFSRTFKKLIGVSPSRYRDRGGMDEE